MSAGGHDATGAVHGVSGGLSPYRRLLAVPGSRRLAVADLCARLPQGMLSLTVLLVAAEHASSVQQGWRWRAAP